MTHIQELFIKNLRFLRTKAGFSQLEFSEKISLSPNYLNAIENGKNFPSVDVLQKISDVLDIMPYQLFLESQTSDSAENIQKISDLKQKIIKLFEMAENTQS
jgi:transcriptional regulator with XRE-family HTH domain